jgi:hypothetical protein
VALLETKHDAHPNIGISQIKVEKPSAAIASDTHL